MNTDLSSSRLTDEDLILAVGRGEESALRPLYSRYAPGVFAIAYRAMGVSGSEEVVQEVFAGVWQHAARFEPMDTPARVWMLALCRSRIALALRVRGRTTELSDEEWQLLTQGFEEAIEGNEPLWGEHRRQVLRQVLEQLPDAQRQALSLAYLTDLGQEEVSTALGVPLSMTRIRMRKQTRTLRWALVATVCIVGGLAVLGAVSYSGMEAKRRLTERALATILASDGTELRLTPAPGMAAEVQGAYRYRRGSTIGVMTVRNLPALGAGKRYAGWASERGEWVLLGTSDADASGRAIIVRENGLLGERPDAVMVTVESSHSPSVPARPAVLRWPSS